MKERKGTERRGGGKWGRKRDKEEEKYENEAMRRRISELTRKKKVSSMLNE